MLFMKKFNTKKNFVFLFLILSGEIWFISTNNNIDVTVINITPEIPAILKIPKALLFEAVSTKTPEARLISVFIVPHCKTYCDCIIRSVIEYLLRQFILI